MISTLFSFCIALHPHNIIWQRTKEPGQLNRPCYIYNANGVPVYEGRYNICPAKKLQCDSAPVRNVAYERT